MIKSFLMDQKQIAENQKDEALKAYDRVLELVPHHEGAAKNRKMIQDIIDEINSVSESQKGEEGEASKP